MKHVKTHTLPIVCTSILIVILLTVAWAKAAPLKAERAKAAPLICGTWKLIASADHQPRDNVLNGVAAIAANNVLAVGSYTSLSRSFLQTLVEQWDGLTWNLLPSPNVGVYDNALNGIGFVSASDAWAVGYFSKFPTGGFPYPRTLIEHWNGTAWSVVPSPNVGTHDNTLTAVTVVSTNDVWAAGYYIKNISGITYEQTLTEHWNGTTWSVIPSPAINQEDNFLNGVTAISTNDVWAVGDDDVANFQTLIEHWNGTSWSIVPSPNPGKGFPANNVLSGVAAVSTSDVWAVGSDFNKSGTQQTMAEHWNGTSWSAVPSPNSGTSSNALTGIAVVSTSDSWTVGHYHNTSTKLDQTLIEQWNGTSWSVVPSPNVVGFGAQDNSLASVASIVGSSQAWTVGNYNDGFGLKTLTEFSC